MARAVDLTSSLDTSTLTPEEWPHMALDADTFGLTICSIVRDSYYLSTGRGKSQNRYWRLATTLYLLILCMVIQIFLLSCVKNFVSAKAVHDVRLAYDEFQNTMYGGNVWVLADTAKLERRGVGGYHGGFFNASKFSELSPKTQASVCRITLSQPFFLFAVLFIWSLTCIAELLKCKELFERLVLGVPIVSSMAEAVKLVEEDSSEHDAASMVVRGLPFGMKLVLVFAVILPRLGITCFLLWVGCRWLLATTSFSDLILNAVALEFVLCLKDLLYMAVVPRRNVLAVENLFIHQGAERESHWAFLSSLFWTGLSAAWVLFYMGWPGVDGCQQVLRCYQWDVHDVCVDWVTWRYMV